MKRILLSLLVIGGAAAIAAAPAVLPNYALPPEIELLIPKHSVKVGWLLPPAKKKTAAPEIFDVDKDGNPWL